MGTLREKQISTDARNFPTNKRKKRYFVHEGECAVFRDVSGIVRASPFVYQNSGRRPDSIGTREGDSRSDENELEQHTI